MSNRREVGRSAAARELAKRQAVANRERWYGDPVAFAREALGIEPTDHQAAVLADLAAHPLTSWRSGQKTGKSDCIAIAALWWVHTRPRALVVLTSGNAQQVRVVLWRALTRLYRGARVTIGGELAKSPSTGLAFEDGRLVVGLTASDETRMAGFSGAELLFLVDESSGFSDSLLEAIMGNLGGDGRLLLAGNPTTTAGLFARTHRERLEGWRLHHTSSRATVNVIAGRVVVKGLATSAWIALMESTFGEGSAAVAVRVDGEYPSEGTDAVVGLSLLDAAVARWRPDVASGATAALEVGVDIARFGDDATVVQGRRGYFALRSAVVRRADTHAVARAVLEYCDEHSRGETVTIRLDSGGLGAGALDVLRSVAGDSRRYVVIGVNASQSPMHERFKNARAELHWSVRRWLERGGALPPDDARDGELLAARYSTDAALRIQIESKDEIKKRLRRSPDRADALALAVYSENPLDGLPQQYARPIMQPGRTPGPHEGGRYGSTDPKAGLRATLERNTGLRPSGSGLFSDGARGLIERRRGKFGW